MQIFWDTFYFKVFDFSLSGYLRYIWYFAVRWFWRHTHRFRIFPTKQPGLLFSPNLSTGNRFVLAISRNNLSPWARLSIHITVPEGWMVREAFISWCLCESFSQFLSISKLGFYFFRCRGFVIIPGFLLKLLKVGDKFLNRTSWGFIIIDVLIWFYIQADCFLPSGIVSFFSWGLWWWDVPLVVRARLTSSSLPLLCLSFLIRIN